jgi:hypothetical protein
VFITGSGGMNLTSKLGAKFRAGSERGLLAVEKLHPDADRSSSWAARTPRSSSSRTDPETGRKKKIPSMNDKCAGGTGAVIDKINAKLRFPRGAVRAGLHGIKLHHVAGKCGVFAETDINGLQKQGIPSSELMASLFEAIIGRTSRADARAHAPPRGASSSAGPNTYIRGMREAWQHHIPRMWKEREVAVPDGVDPKTLIVVPENAQYYAALGAVEYGKDEDEGSASIKDGNALEEYIQLAASRARPRQERASARTRRTWRRSWRRYTPGAFVPADLRPR